MSGSDELSKLLLEKGQLEKEYKRLCDARADMVASNEEKLTSYSAEIDAIRSGVAIKKDLIDLFEDSRQCGSSVRVLVPGYFYTTDTFSGISSIQSTEDLKKA